MSMCIIYESHDVGSAGTFAHNSRLIAVDFPL